MNVSVNEAKRMIQGKGLVVKDVSAGSSYGYDYAIFRTETITEPVFDTRAVGEPLAQTTMVYEPDTINKKGQPGSYRPMFNLDEVKALYS